MAKPRVGKKFTTAQWVAQAIEVHGHTYDYSTVVYTHSLKKVVVTCKLHGPFEVTPNNHTIAKSGCPVCAGRLCGDRHIFKVRAKTIHGAKYDYSLVQPFLTTDDTVTIVCSIHGRFEQRIQVHLNGCGCPHCGWTNGGLKQRGVKRKKMTTVTI